MYIQKNNKISNYHKNNKSSESQILQLKTIPCEALSPTEGKRTMHPSLQPNAHFLAINLPSRYGNTGRLSRVYTEKNSCAYIKHN